MAQPLDERPCAKCGTTYQPKAAHQKYCGDLCRGAAYQARYPEVRRARMRRWRHANTERYNALMRRWRQTHRESCRESKRKHYVAHRDQQRSARIAQMLQHVPDDPFVHAIMTSLFMLRSEAKRAQYGRSGNGGGA